MREQTIKDLKFYANLGEGDNYTITRDILSTLDNAIYFLESDKDFLLKKYSNKYYCDLVDNLKVLVIDSILKLDLEPYITIFKIQSFILNWMTVEQALRVI